MVHGWHGRLQAVCSCTSDAAGPAGTATHLRLPSMAGCRRLACCQAIESQPGASWFATLCSGNPAPTSLHRRARGCAHCFRSRLGGAAWALRSDGGEAQRCWLQAASATFEAGSANMHHKQCRCAAKAVQRERSKGHAWEWAPCGGGLQCVPAHLDLQLPQVPATLAVLAAAVPAAQVAALLARAGLATLAALGATAAAHGAAAGLPPRRLRHGLHPRAPQSVEHQAGRALPAAAGRGSRCRPACRCCCVACP